MKPAIASCVLERRYTVEEALSIAADAGYAGYEIDVGPSPHYSIFGGETDLGRMRDPKRWAALGHAAASSRIRISSICLGALHGFGLGDPDEGIRSQGVAILKETCRAASDIGVNVILVPIPQPKDTPVPQSQRNVIESLKRCLDMAQECGVVLAVENMPNDMYGPADQILKVMGEVGSEFCRVYYDVANPECIGIHAKDEVPQLSSLIHQVHIKDLSMPTPEQVSVVDIGRGDVDLVSGVEALKKIGYQGFVVVEVPTEPDEALRAARDNLKELNCLGIGS